MVLGSSAAVRLMLAFLVVVFLLCWLFFGASAALGFARFVVGAILILIAAVVIMIVTG